MDWDNAFEPLRDFFQRRKALAKFRQLPAITVQGTENYYRANTSPSPDQNVQILNEAGDQVGTAAYAITPLNDQLWLYEIDVAREYRRQGYGLAFLRYLNQTHDLPVTAIHEVYLASSFWGAARLLDGHGLRVTQPLSDSDIRTQQKRWQHLQPIQTRLLDVIQARLARGENWYHAIGRGLDE